MLVLAPLPTCTGDPAYLEGFAELYLEVQAKHFLRLAHG